MTNCKMITNADIRSDHRLVRMTLMMNKRLARLKTIKSKNHSNINIQKLKVMKERFEIILKKIDLKTSGEGDSQYIQRNRER